MASVVLFIISFSIVIPCITRAFYINQIDQLDVIHDVSRYVDFEVTKQTIIDAFNSVMDFIWKGKPFATNPETGAYLTGQLPLSVAGKEHFADCIPLFWLDFVVFTLSTLSLTTLMLLYVTKRFTPVKIFKFNPFFLSGLITLTLILVIGVLVLTVDFDVAFEVFHKIFFPGKDNWLFSASEDVIINMLTEEFFMNCAIFIGSMMVGLSLVSVGYGVIDKVITIKKTNKA